MGAMEHKPRWAEMCARILQQCVFLAGGREPLAQRLDAAPEDLDRWLAAQGGPPAAIFDKAMDMILAEHDRRAREEAAGAPAPRRRKTDLN